MFLFCSMLSLKTGTNTSLLFVLCFKCTNGKYLCFCMQATISAPVKDKMFKRLRISYCVIVSRYFSVAISLVIGHLVIKLREQYNSPLQVLLPTSKNFYGIFPFFFFFSFSFCLCVFIIIIRITS